MLKKIALKFFGKKNHYNPLSARKTGAQAEREALKFLKKAGLILLEKNFSCKMGEIDLIMQDAETLVFVEVRFRKNKNFGGALATITKEKQRKIKNTANFYLQKTGIVPLRFDFVGLTLDENKKIIVEDWIKNIF